eukprot:COSAG02_NODE_9860_length_2089_cov_1.629648_1_plen_545_part_01
MIKTGEVVGLTRLAQLARAAESAGDWWLAARYWSVAREVTYQECGNGAASDPNADQSLAAKSLHAISQMSEAANPEAKDDIRFKQAQTIIAAYDVPTLIERYSDLDEILRTRAAAREAPSTCGSRLYLGTVISFTPGWTFEQMGDNYARAFAMALKASQEDPDPQQRTMSALMAISGPHCADVAMLSRNFSWEAAYGLDGEDCIAAFRAYEFRAHHPVLVASLNADWGHQMPGFGAALLRWGDLSFTEENIDQSIDVFRCCMDETLHTDEISEQIGFMFGLPVWGQYMYATEQTFGLEKIAGLMVDNGLTYRNAHKTCDTCRTSFIRKRGDTALNQFPYSVEFLSLFAQMSFVVTASNPGVSAEEILAELPSIDEIVHTVMTFEGLSMPHTACGYFSNLFYAAAAVCEKFGDYERSLDYVDAALSSDIKRAGTRFPTSRVTSQLLRGRVLFSLGRTPEAAKALEGAAGEAHKFGFRLYEAYALRDLKLFVLDDMGHGDHASRRLGAVLRLLKGPPEKLAPLLKGLDPAELMALPAPDAGYEVRYE